MQMNLYISGILYARLDLYESLVYIELLDPYTGLLKPSEPLTDQITAQLYTLSRISFQGLAERLRNAQTILDANPAVSEFTLPDGAIYQRKDEHHYIQRQIKFPLDLLTDNGRIIGARTPNRDSTSLLISEGYESLTLLPQWNALYPNTPYALAPVQTCRIPMRDGTKLVADLWLPQGITEPLPCVLVRTPYGRQDSAPAYYRFVQRGYAVVIQDVRGRNDSEGEWIPDHFETEDGSDTIDWIAAQNWCSGSVGMIGGSYLGYVQWAAAASENPHLKALISEVTAGSAFVDMPRHGGTFSSGTLAWAFAVSQKKMNDSLMVRDDWDQILAHRPLEEICEKALGYPVPFWTEWLSHPCDDAFWQKGDWYDRSVKRGGIHVPALIMSGWFDDNGMGTTQALDLTSDYPSGTRKVILGPWMHSGNANYDLHGIPMGQNAIRYDLDLQFFRWFEYWLKGRETGITETAPVEYFTIGEDKWKTAGNWPPEKSEEYSLYPGGSQANTSNGNGILLESPGQYGSDSFLYDPENPATHIIDMSENEIEVPEDYTEQELRPDYLCYTTPPLEQPLTITGDAYAELYLSSDAPDTDLMVRLTKVTPDGRSIKLADGMLDVKFRNGFDREIFLEPGKVEKVLIRTTKISACFAPGERLRLTITSSAVNFAFPNSNTKDGYNSTVTRTANNTIHHGTPYPSRIILRKEINA